MENSEIHKKIYHVLHLHLAFTFNKHSTNIPLLILVYEQNGTKWSRSLGGFLVASSISNYYRTKFGLNQEIKPHNRFIAIFQNNCIRNCQSISNFQKKPISSEELAVKFTLIYTDHALQIGEEVTRSWMGLKCAGFLPWLAYWKTASQSILIALCTFS